MKLLRIISSMDPKLGGPCQGIRNSIPALQAIGVNNEVLSLDNPDEEFLKHDNFVIHAIGAPKDRWGYNATLSRWLETHLCEYNIVIIHGIWLYHSFATIKAVAKLRKKAHVPKVFIMPHGMLDPWFQRDKTRKLKAIRNEIYWVLIEKKVVNSADGLLFTCEEELLLARKTFRGYHPKKEFNVGYGIQPPPTHSALMLPALKNKPYLLYLSRIHPKKGVDLLIEAYKILCKTNKDIPSLVIAGSLDSSYAKNMVTLANNCDKIYFAGMLQNAAKWGAFYGLRGLYIT